MHGYNASSLWIVTYDYIAERAFENALGYPLDLEGKTHWRRHHILES